MIFIGSLVSVLTGISVVSEPVTDLIMSVCQGTKSSLSCLILADIQDPLVEKSGVGNPTVDLTGEEEGSSITAGSVPEVVQDEAEATPTQKQEVQTEATPTQHHQESREQEQTDAACKKLPSQEETEKVVLDIGRRPREGYMYVPTFVYTFLS